MSIDFSFKDFAYPVDILRFRSFLEKSQWFSQDLLERYEAERLRMILSHAYKNVPYYRELFRSLDLTPSDFRSKKDLSRLPLLTKDILRKNFKQLTAENSKKFNPVLHKTSGTSGEPVEFYHDKFANILEFCYYWRYWSWAGYRLGMPFAEFTLHHFLNAGMSKISDRSAISKRLCLNPTRLSYENIHLYVEQIKKGRSKFLKGSPSTIHMFAILVEKHGIRDLSFEAVFTTGELLLPHQRSKIAEIFGCKILDSYGHMERTVAISQCPRGSYHINSEYGILEVDKDEAMSLEQVTIGRVIGTSLHNFAMPLIRYLTEDVIEVDASHAKCGCGRTLPLCEKVIGRQQNIITTPDGRYLTNVFILFEMLEGILWAQIVQEDIKNIKVRIVKDVNFSISSQEGFLKHLSDITGKDMQIEVEYLDAEMLDILRSQKYKPVVSNIICAG